MYIANGWHEYELLDAGGGDKLERWGEITLLRPDPIAIWPMRETIAPDARYIRSSAGGGHWEYGKQLPDSWHIHYRNLVFLVRPTGFKHTGLFPEQAVNWDWMCERLFPGARVLNLFAYTGGATCALAQAGAHVTHVDAAKGMVNWAKENAALNGLSSAPLRFLVDDAMKFVLREGRRGNRYDGILMDPPSYGRGPDGEVWKIENQLYGLVEAAVRLLSDTPVFFLINSYTTGLSPSVLQSLLRVALHGRNAKIEADEIGLPIRRDGLVLPCGASGRAWWKG